MMLIWAAALSLQLLYLAESYEDPTFLQPIVDAMNYDKIARGIASGQFLPDGAFWQPPLYQYFLAGIYLIFGPHIIAAKIIQAMIGATSCLMTYLIGRRLFSRATGVIAGLIMAFYGPMIFFNSQLLSTGLEVFLYLLALSLLLCAAEGPRPSRWLACGLMIGLAAITRPNILVLLAGGLAVIILLLLRQRSYRGWVICAACFILGTALTIAPATLCNYLVERRFLLISTNGGINLFIGNNPRAEETTAIRPGMDWRNFVDMSRITGASTMIEQDQYFFRQAKDFFIQQPDAAIRNLLRKARLFWNSYETPRNMDIYVFRRFSWLLSLLVWRCGSFSFPFGILAPLSFLGMIVGCRGKRGRVILLAFVALYSASVIAFFIAARYRLPAVPALAVFAAQGILWFRHRVLARRYLSVIAAILFCLVTGTLVNFPVRAPTHRVNFHAELYKLLAMHHLHINKDPAAAEEEFRRSLAIESAHETHYHLANLLVKQASYNEALEHFRSTLALKPDHAEAHNNLAGILAKMGKTDEALQHYRKSLIFKPDSPDGVYLNVVILLKRERRFAEASNILKAGILNHPESASMKANLAWVLATCPEEKVRDGQEAVRLAEAACAQTGYSKPDLLETLAAAYAEAGKFDEAVKRAQEAARLSESLGRKDLARQIESRIKLYRANKPYRDRE